MKITELQIQELANSIGLQYAHLKALIVVETGGKGFDEKTKKILIQFEPHWYKKNAPYAPSGLWSVNKVDVQSKEWEAFNNAFNNEKNDPIKSKKNQTAALLATSIGLPQIMGFNFDSCGYKSVNEMWDDFKISEYNQVAAMTRFIKNNKKLVNALLVGDWPTVATIYNGSGYKELAKKYGREPYDISMRKAFDLYKTKVIK